jgi:exopolysaccharide biosynthesis polyprenyl glycosylphosphotransferase
VIIIAVIVAAIALARDWSTSAVIDARIGSGGIAGVLMILSLTLFRAWDERILGVGSEELKRLYRSFAAASIGLGLTGLALRVQSVRPWVFLVIPACGVLCCLSRFVLRKFLHRARRQQKCMLPVLAVGGDRAVADLIARTLRDPYFGWRITGACIPARSGEDSTRVAGVPVVGDLHHAGNVARAGHYAIVAVAAAPNWGPHRLQSLAWELEGTNTELAVDPGLMEIAGPRLHITPVDGLPLLRLTEPRFTGWRRVLKAVFDRCAASLILVAISPILATIALLVRLDGGPSLYRQERVGRDGRIFKMVKFRSMVLNADRQMQALTKDNQGAGPLFKMRNDPRVTRIGTFLRRYSLDELPQLFNVLTGSMSLVGPRPPLPREVQTYGCDARRKLLVRPGMTGLWQISGRSDLSWEESIRLDLRYVENWSIATDATIIWKTAGAVIRAHGAY